jgi:isoleucyl-tRNA synthetase
VLETPEEGMKEASELSFKVGVRKASGEKCARCWNFSGSVGENKDFPQVCKRCYDIINRKEQ